MKTLLAALVLILASCASAPLADPTPAGLQPGLQADGSYVMHIPKTVAETCDSQGGCALVTEEGLVMLMKKAVISACGRDA